MMNAGLLKEAKVQELFRHVPDHLDLYRNGDFNFIKIDPSYFIETKQKIDEIKLTEVACDENDHREVENCVTIYEAMGKLSLYLARDQRLWVYLVHTDLLHYARNRWPIPDNEERAINLIQLHFFVKGARGFERDNAASRLWWMAALCNRIKDFPLAETLTCFLHDYDTRAGIIERPTTSQSINVFSALIKKLHEFYKKDPNLINRDNFRPVMRRLNLIGGIKLLASLGQHEMENILEECIDVML